MWFSKKLCMEMIFFDSGKAKNTIVGSSWGKREGCVDIMRACGGNHGGWMESMVGHVTVWWECGMS
jgi:hypothetical protein